jgi:uncharacterized protein (DUF1810 family)
VPAANKGAGDPVADLYNLQHFISAQELIIAEVLSELEMGEKRTHWMWFIFPQVRGLGQSELARLYSISSKEEAIAYAGHPILGQRLEKCCQLVNSLVGRSAIQIFGHTDALKLRSSMTLFASVSGATSIFRDILEKYYDGKPDEATLEILREV